MYLSISILAWNMRPICPAPSARRLLDLARIKWGREETKAPTPTQAPTRVHHSWRTLLARRRTRQAKKTEDLRTRIP